MRIHVADPTTWPWSREAIRDLIVALVVRVLIWATQFGLKRLLEEAAGWQLLLG